MNDITHILESLLFVAEAPLTVDRLKNILETVESKQIRAALNELAEHYEARGGGFGLYEVAGGWQLRSRPEYTEWIKRMLQPPAQRLTKATLETLAIVAYNQPIIRADIEHIRGVDCGGVLRQLLERKLIRVLGRKEIPGRPLIYATTKLFLELFELKDLKDLPSPKEIETMTAAQDNVDAASDKPESEVLPDGPFEAMSVAAQADGSASMEPNPIAHGIHAANQRTCTHNGRYARLPLQTMPSADTRASIDANTTRIFASPPKIASIPAGLPGGKSEAPAHVASLSPMDPLPDSNRKTSDMKRQKAKKTLTLE